MPKPPPVPLDDPPDPLGDRPPGDEEPNVPELGKPLVAGNPVAGGGPVSEGSWVLDGFDEAEVLGAGPA